MFRYHEFLWNHNMPLDELGNCEAAILELPDKSEPHREVQIHSMLSWIMTILDKIAVVVMPSMDKKSAYSSWVNRYNRIPGARLKFHRTCSCQVAPRLAAHMMLFVACTEQYAVPGPCHQLAPPRATKPTMDKIMIGVGVHLAESLPVRVRAPQCPPRQRPLGPNNRLTRQSTLPAMQAYTRQHKT